MKKDITIASFDIGIKNLAFCVMQYDPSQNDGCQFRILCWKNIDLTDRQGITAHTCEGQTKKKKACSYPSKIKTNDGHFYCLMHNPDKKKYKPKKTPKVRNIPLEKLCVTLASRLDEFKEWWKNVNEVIIETQFKRNRKMICTSDMLYSYFVIKGIMSEESQIKHVKFVSSRNKLKVYNGPFIKSDLKGPKDKRKHLAVKYCEYMIRNDDQSLSYLNKFPKKKDDLSDCFLQGAFYLKSKYKK